MVALLRGINLGASRRVAMADLRACLERLGYEDVETLLQSGNAVYRGTDAAATSERRIERALLEATGLEIPVAVRTARQMAAVVRRNPLAEHASDPKRHHVVFLSEKPAASRAAALDAKAYDPELFRLHGRELYVWWPEGVHRARLTLPAIERSLGVVGTARNWNTVEKLAALSAG
ncbi:MAG TPA: DUF1697 domain-containing protein [Gaiellales bacterium]|nr:DUF1697 domain-containing protein [Gaiellales bacterium]